MPGVHCANQKPADFQSEQISFKFHRESFKQAVSIMACHGEYLAQKQLMGRAPACQEPMRFQLNLNITEADDFVAERHKQTVVGCFDLQLHH